MAAAQPPAKDQKKNLLVSAVLREARRVIPTLSADLRKGNCGKIGIVGGSFEYTGAPYFAGMAALRTGADLCHIFCTAEAAVPIKSYSPELMVHPLLPTTTNPWGGEKKTQNPKEVPTREEEHTENGPLDSSKSQMLDSSKSQVLDSGKSQPPPETAKGPEGGKSSTDAKKSRGSEGSKSQDRKMSAAVPSLGGIEKWLPRLSVLVVGPGLGRDATTQAAVVQIVKAAADQNIPLVIDADGLQLVSFPDFANAVRSTPMCVFTPNFNELKRMLGGPPASLANGAVALAARYSVAVVLKGAEDWIVKGADAIKCEEGGCLKRSGGQGDVLTGCIATFVSWAWARGRTKILGSRSKGPEKLGGKISVQKTDPLLAATFGAVYLMRHATQEAFKLHNRSVSATMIIDVLGTKFVELFETGDTLDFED